MKVVNGTAPVRVCDNGGWTDTWFCERGAVTNLTVDMLTRARVEENGLGMCRIFAGGLGLTAVVPDAANPVFDGNLDLLKAALKRGGVEGGVDMYVDSDSPPGCGTGTSASAAVAALGALWRYAGKQFGPEDVAAAALALETDDLGLQSGAQDQYAAAFGGINLIEVDFPRAKVTRLNVPDAAVKEFGDRLCVVYFGPRASNEMHMLVVDRYRAGDRMTLDACTELEACARDMAAALEAGDVDGAGETMWRNWRAQRDLHENMSTAMIDRAEVVARRLGAAGFKVNGAGGGGSATVLSAAGKCEELRAAMVESGFRILPCGLYGDGLKTWDGA